MICTLHDVCVFELPCRGGRRRQEDTDSSDERCERGGKEEKSIADDVRFLKILIHLVENRPNYSSQSKGTILKKRYFLTAGQQLVLFVLPPKILFKLTTKIALLLPAAHSFNNNDGAFSSDSNFELHSKPIAFLFCWQIDWKARSACTAIGPEVHHQISSTNNNTTIESDSTKHTQQDDEESRKIFFCETAKANDAFCFFSLFAPSCWMLALG
jgi:hypothetical protein